MALRYDLGQLKPVRRMPDGTVRVDAWLTRCGVFSYAQPDGSVRRELRPREEVMKPESLATFVGLPFVDDHPVEMIDANNATTYAKGGLATPPVPDGDNVRSTISVWNADTIAKMDGGKLQISCGYNCDLEEKSGVDPQYGPYDAIQRNIVGNHVALVEQGRAGTAHARMDGMMVRDYSEDQPRAADGRNSLVDHADGTPVAFSNPRAIIPSMATPASLTPAARLDVVVTVDQGRKDKDPDADDREGDPADEDREQDPADEDEGQDIEDGYGAGPDGNGMRDGDDLTQGDRDKLAAESFAVPEDEGLPINNAAHVRAAMSRFNQYKFKGADSKHAAYNRIIKRAKQFGVSSDGFQKAEGNHLDRIDPRSIEEMNDLKKTQEALDAASKRADAEKTRADSAEARADSEKARADKAESLIEKTRKDAQDVQAGAVKARVALLTEVASVLGQDKDGSRLDKSDRDLRLSVIKHVDKLDVPAEKSADYVEAYYASALARARKDAQDTVAGDQALSNARRTIEENRTDAQDKTQRADGMLDEQAAQKRLRQRTVNAWTQENK